MFFCHAADHLLITQVQITGGSGMTANDFIEIFNPTGQAVDLKGFRLVKRTKTGTFDTLIKSWTQSAIVPAGGFFLWANSDYSGISVAPDATTTATIAEDNGVALRNGASDTGQIIDAVAWGQAQNIFVEGSVFPENPVAGQSLRRKADDTDTNNNAQDFFIQSSAPRNSKSGGSGPAPTATPTPTPVGSQATSTVPVIPGGNLGWQYLASLFINEIMPNPTGRDPGNEWVEFYNSGIQSTDLSGWILDDEGPAVGDSAYVLPEGNEMGSFGYLMVKIPSGSFALNNSGRDCLRLFSPDRVLQKELCYSGEAREGESYALAPEGGYLWTSMPTPGSINAFPVTNFTGKSKFEIVINELLPNPGDDEDQEFIELKNIGDDEADLTGWKLADDKRTYVISDKDFSDTSVSPNGLFLVPRSVSKIALNNTGGETVQLIDAAGKVADTVSYSETAKENYAYARRSDGKFEWTSVSTPGKDNQFSSMMSGVSEEKSLSVEEKIKEESGAVLGASVAATTLEEARTMPLGSKVQVTAAVVAAPGTLGKNVAYLSGSGMRISFLADGYPELAVGDIVTVAGELAIYHKELELKVDPKEITKTGAVEVKSPQKISTDQVGEPMEGFLVRVAGEVTETSGDTFYIDDGSGPAKIQILDGTGIIKPKMRKGDVAVITGIVSQYDENYRLLPRFQADVEVGVTSSTRTLPRTGAGYWAAVVMLCAAALILYEMLLYSKRAIK